MFSKRSNRRAFDATSCRSPAIDKQSDKHRLASAQSSACCSWASDNGLIDHAAPITAISIVTADMQ
jgi:hypothetical protein